MILYESERKVMEALWSEGSIKASDLVKVLEASAGWNRNTTYTVLKKCIDKKLVKRSEEGYICTPLVSRKQIQREEAAQLLEESFGGSVTKLISAVLDVKSVSKYEVKEIKKILAKK